MEDTHSTPAAPAAAAVQKDYSALYIPGAIIVAGLIIGGSLIIAFKGSGTSQGATGQQPTIAVNVEDVVIDDHHPYIGEKNAPVTLVAWEDYQCPFCKAVEVGHEQIPGEPAMPQLIEEYVKTGKLKIVFKNYAFLGDDSKIAALYDLAVWKLYPQRYHEFREAMYNAQDEEHGGFGNETSILAMIKKELPGMDGAKLKADVTANVETYTKQMDEDRAEGASFGITGTPGFITGEVLIPGAVGIAEFKAAIDPQL